jgi:Raf kinase inhibitor-like YbhB/YbcL family protein
MIAGLHRHPFVGIKHKLFHALVMGAVLAGVLVTTGSVVAPPETRKKLDVSSSAFKNGQPIPSQYTCDGKNISPPLTWKGAPNTTQSFVLIADDPDAPTDVWTHWVVFNLGADASELREDFVNSPDASGSAKQGMNSFKNVAYGGPCPPAGKAHRYFFKVYALDITLNLQPGASRNDVEAAMTKHMVAIGQLMGTYQRK